MFMELTASVIICTRNRRDDIIRCLNSIAQQTMLPHELIIVDSSDISLMQLPLFQDVFNAATFPQAKCIYLHTRPGLTYQRNRGIEKATKDIIYFFDDDVVLLPAYLAKMHEIFCANTHYAGGMGDISNINQKISWRYQWFRKFFLLPHEGGSGRFTFSGMPTHPYGTQEFKNVEILGGCCMAIRRNIAQQFLFDETLGGYCYLEDADIACRISRHYQLFFNPKAQLIHNESPQARDRAIDTSAMFVYNYSYLFFKNFYPYNRLKIVGYWWSLCGLFVQSVLYRDWDQLKGFWRGLIKFYKK
jgi:GT2 family glycosyltransferase